MRIGIMVNDVATEKSAYTTIRLAMTATNRGHEVWFIGLGDFAYDADELVRARATAAPQRKFKATNAYLSALQGPRALHSRITVDDLDVLLLRSDPAEESRKRPWAQTAGIDFGRIAMRHGVVVLNDPNGLSKALNKMYFQTFPSEVRPATIITRDNTEIREFVEEQGGWAVIKPVQGSGGQGVFLVKPESRSNLNQMVDALTRDGYVIAQEYLPKAAEGDTRLFMMNGAPLKRKGHYAAFRRVRKGDDLRSNISAGGEIQRAEIDDTALRVAEIVRPKLVADGMFLVGLDVVGDKLMEVNVFSPGGLGSSQKFERVNFAHTVIDSLETKVRYMEDYQRRFSNIQLNTL